VTAQALPAAGVIGVGATGARAARQLVGSDAVGSVLLAGGPSLPRAGGPFLPRAGGPGPEDDRAQALRRSLGDRASVADPFDAGAHTVVLAGPSGTHANLAREAIRRRVNVVSTADSVAEVRALLDLDTEARAVGVSVVVGAGFSPGMSCVLARHVTGWMDEVEEIHLARFGTGGPACARSHHRALSGRSTDWRDGEWVRRPGGSGRELCVFPDPVGSVDCYRAALPDAVLLHRALPQAGRITARQAANRRQRLTAWLPMLRRPHPEGRIGAVRVEARGRRNGTSVTEVVGAIDRPAVAAGAVAGLAARRCIAGEIPPGAGGLAGSVEPVAFLEELAELGVRAAVFVGTG
jgi:saccharopine dehydrogenase-like NADP-dependent oxidoreductase